MSWEAGCSLAGRLWLRVSSRLQWKCWLGLRSHLKVQLREDLLLCSFTYCWWISVSHWLLARDMSSFPSELLYKVSYNMATYYTRVYNLSSFRMTGKRERERRYEKQSNGLFVTGLESDSSLFCHNMEPTIKRREFIYQHECQDEGIIRAYLWGSY